MKRLWYLAVLLVMLALVLAACGTETPVPTATTAPPTAEPTQPPAEPAKEKLKVAFVYVAPIGDMGWTWAHEQGRQAVEQALGGNVETAFIENVPEGPEAERVIRDFAQKGYDLVFTTSFGFMDPTITVAEEFPDTKFVHISGYKTADNVSTVFGRIEEARYLSGLIAGKMTKSNKIGFVAAFPIPEVIRGINGFTQGVREVNPDAEVLVVWTNTWFGPPQEKEAADALLAQGADIIAQHQDTTEPQKAAADAGGFSIGYDSDMAQFVGDTVLTSPVWNWGPKYVEIAKSVMDGAFKSETYWGGMSDGIVDLAPLSAKVPADVAAMVDQRKQEILDGKFKLFCGPIYGQNDELVVPEGKCLSDPEQLSIDWFFQGVQGEAPKTPPASAGEADAPAGAAAAPAMENVKVAFVYVAPIGDMGWTWAHEQGRQAIEQALGDNVETAFIENVPEGPEAERVIRDFAQKGFNLIFTTSFGFMDPTVTVAEEFPDTKFVHISGYKTADNLSTVFGRIEEARYLSGLVAGKATKTNKIGYVAAFPIPEVIRGINGFTQGVREVNPDAEVIVVWTNTWFGPPQEKEAADALLAQGADVIAQHQDTTEPQKAAADAGGFSIGYDSDMAQFVGDTVLTSPIWNWGPKYVEITEAVRNGTFQSESYWGGMADGIVDLAPLSAKVSADVAALVEERKQEMLDGKFKLFCGPIYGQNDELVVPEGKCLSDEEQLSIDWFIQGVKGEAPKAPPAEAGGVAAPVSAAAPSEEVKVAFVYVGPTGDLGWSYAHDQGRLALDDLGYVDSAFSEIVPEGPDAERVIRDYAEKGYNVIFATSFGYMDSVLNVAAEYPDVKFEHATGYKTADNVAIYDGRGYEGWYLAGMTAGLMTENNKLGYVAPFPIPEVVRNMNAFALGARSVNPEVELTPVWINSWFDPPKEREAAQALVDAGVDVVARESDSVEPDKVAEEAGVYAIGYNAVSSDIAPKAVLTAPVWDWGVYYKQTVEAVAQGDWQTHAYWGRMADGLLDLAPFGSMVPKAVQDQVNAAKADIISGDLVPFTGPINDNTGTERVAAGETMTDEELLSFDWLVEGVRGSIPQ